MPTVYLLDPVAVRHSDPNLAPVSGAKLHTWIAGTTTNQATYTDATGVTPLSNPVVADSTGIFPEIWITGSAYDLECRKSDDTTVLWDRLNVTAPAAAVTQLALGSGAGLIGHDISVNYAVATLGAALTGMVNAAELTGVDRTGVTDCTTALNAATLICKRLYLPSGTYLVNAITLRTDLEIFGDGDSTILRPLTTATNFGLSFDSGSSDPANNIKNIYIHDLQLRGWSDTAGLSEHLHLVTLNGVTKVLFDRVTFRAPRGDCVYLGSGTGAGLERHNYNVTFRKCHFDGVDHSNRNGISIIDCRGLYVDDCLFENLTDPTMPGPIDLEPNNLWNVARDIKVRNSRFLGNGGAGGFFTMFLGNIAFTTPPSGILIDGNTIDSNGYTTDIEKGLTLFQYGDADSTRLSLDCMVSNNTFRDIGYPIHLDGTVDVTYRDNRWLGTTAEGRIGFTYKPLHTNFEDNYFYQIASDNSTGGNGLTIFNANFIDIRRNRFINCGKANGSLGYAIHFSTGASSSVVIDSNLVTGANTTKAIQATGGHTFSAATNALTDNGFGALAYSDFPAAYGSKSYTPGTIGTQAQGITTVAAVGARLGYPTMCSFSLDQAGLIFTSYVSASDVITVLIDNNTGSGASLGAGTLSAWVRYP